MGRASCGGVSGITGRIRAVESADAVEAEAVGAVVGPVEDGRRGTTGHRLTCPLQPAAILCTLALERAPKGRRQHLYNVYVYYINLHAVGRGGCLSASLPLGLVGDVVARPALVFAQRSHLEARLVAALRLQHGIGHRGRGRTAELAEGFWEGPETVFHAGQGIVCTCGKMDRDAKVKNKTKQRPFAQSATLFAETRCKVSWSCFVLFFNMNSW